MENLIRNYKVSCDMAKERIGELLVQRRHLRRIKNRDAAELLDLNRRIRLLYTEYEDMKEIIKELEGYGS